jgi:tetratricopeptide (TPR) repeat protein
VLSACTTKADHARMRNGLDSINVLNRNGQPFTIADVQPYVQFFDDHGTANDRLLAHYLLGRAYHVHGEAPMALQCYQDALDYADTLSGDCDYVQLSRVFGQMAQIFYEQGLYRQHIQCEKKSIKFAWLGNDTLAALMSNEQEFLSYYELGIIDSAIIVIEEVAHKYNQYGRSVNSAISLGLAIPLLIDKREFPKAKHYMNLYESYSGRFDSHGNIEAGREIYYKTKGLYFLYTENLDSAEYYFRKELRNGSDLGNQNSAANGLALLYHKIHKPDSAAKYAIYAYTMLDSVYAQRSTKEVERMQALYDYTRHQEIAHQEQKKANQRTIIIWICVGIIIVICLLTFIIIRELTRKKKTAEQKYMQSLSSIEQAQSDIVKLQTNAEINKELISEKEQIIREQETIMKSLLRHDSNSQSLADRKLIDTDIYKRFEQLSTKGQQPTQEEWEQIEQQIFFCYPGFKDLLSKHGSAINDKEYKTCLLIRIGIKPTNISSMLGVASSYITELRTKMLQKLFGMSGSSKSFDKLLKTIY